MAFSDITFMEHLKILFYTWVITSIVLPPILKCGWDKGFRMIEKRGNLKRWAYITRAFIFIWFMALWNILGLIVYAFKQLVFEKEKQ